MEIIKNSYQLEEISYAVEKYFDSQTLFFDIECTGLSPRKSFIYLIGYALRKDKEVTIVQLLACDESEELEVLTEFEQVMDSYPKLLGFNSTRFDESFIVERCRKYGLSTNIKSKKHIDMYLATTKAKCLLDLPNYKQKTIEKFLGLHRDDQYDGGQLIPVYQHYSLMKDNESKKLILLHNYEDVKGMIYITDILSYPDLLNTDLRYINHEFHGGKLRFEIENDIYLPNMINKTRSYGIYIIKENRIYVTLNMVNTELYTYLPDYRNYYYLPAEDIIIPKSIGQSIDKDNKRPAKKSDCKVKKEGSFIQLPEKLEISGGIHIFKPSYNSTESYIDSSEVTPAALISITRYMLKH